MAISVAYAKREYTTLESVRVAHNGAYPGFLFVRHLLAIIILAHHSRVLLRGVREGYGDVVNDMNTVAAHGWLSFLASTEAFRPLLYALVGAFFALSGFLVAGSALRTKNVRTFLVFRGLRIFPALMSEITLSALLLGAAVTTLPLADYFADIGLYKYFLNILGFIHYTLPGVFPHNPISEMVNANLWTLGPEFYCYLIMAAAMASGLVYNRRRFIIALLIVTIVIAAIQFSHVVEFSSRQDTTRFSRWLIVYMFFVGVALSLFSDYVPRNFYLFAACTIGYVLLMWSAKSDLIAGLLLAYCIVYIGSLDFEWFDRAINSDYSYGLYLYGYPITQTLIFFLVPAGILKTNTTSMLLLFGLTLVLTLAFSALSWKFLEHPALGLRRYFLKART